MILLKFGIIILNLEKSQNLLLVKLMKKINWFRSNKISLSPNFPKYHIHKNLIDFLKIPVVLPKNPQIFIEDAKIQLLIIEEFLKNEFDKIQIKSIQIIKLFRNYIKFYLSKDEFELTGSLFLTGSNTNIISRIMSANFRKRLTCNFSVSWRTFY